MTLIQWCVLGVMLAQVTTVVRSITYNENKLVYDQMKRFLFVYTAPPPLDTADLGTDEKAVVFGGRVLDKSRLISRAAEKMYFYQTSNACWLQNDEIKTSSFSIKHSLRLEDGRRYWGGEAVNERAVLGGTAVTESFAVHFKVCDCIQRIRGASSYVQLHYIHWLLK